MKKDRVELYSSTSNNTVGMDEKDNLKIWYNQPGVLWNGQTIQDEIADIEIQGEGTSEQELQLQQSLTEGQYEQHKLHQKFEK